MADFAGGATESFTQTDSGQSSTPSTSQVSSAAPSAAPSYSQSPAATPVVRNESGQFQSPSQTQPTQQFQGQSPGVLAALKASGYDVSGFQDDRSFLSAIDARLTEAESYKKQVEDYQRQLAARGQPIPGSFERIQEHLSTPVETKNGWNPPQYDVRNDQFFRFDEQSKRYVPNQPNVPYELVQAKNDYMDYRANFAKEWSENPIDTLWSRTEDRNRALIREEMANLFKQMQVTKETNDWLDKNKQVLFVDGQIDHTGDPAKLTQAGHLAMQAADELDKAGVSDPAMRRSMTERYIASELSKQYIQQQQQPENRRYTIEEIQQAFRAAQGLPPEQPAQQTAPQQQVPQQFQPQAPVPQGVYMPPQVQPMPQGWLQQQYQQPQMQYQQPMMPQQMAPVPQMPGYHPQVMPPGYLPNMAPPMMTPEQVNEAGKRRFVGGVGHSSSAGPSGGATGEFVPQPSSSGKPNFLNIANQIAQARGLQL